MAVADFATKAIQRPHSNTRLPRFGPQYVLDALVWLVAILLVLVLRYDFDLSRIAWRRATTERFVDHSSNERGQYL